MEPAARLAFLDSTAPLRPGHAVAALLQLADGRYVLQLRDAKADIFFPGHWGCFGGAVDADESDLDAMIRELGEELGLAPGEADCRYFTEFTFDFGFAGHGVVRRRYFTVSAPFNDTSRFVLGEGAAVGAFTAAQALVDTQLVPHDALALWLHDQRHRLVDGASGPLDAASR